MRPLSVENNGNEASNVKTLIDKPSNKNIRETSNKNIGEKSDKNIKDRSDKIVKYPGRKS